MFRRPTVPLFLLTLVGVLLFPQVSHATIVGAQSTGADMAGGRISVFFQNAGIIAAPIVTGAPTQGMASIPGLFDFSVTGDTFLANWMLTNTSGNDTINGVLFDLAGSNALFDDNSMPSTPVSGLGRAGALHVAGPSIAVSGEVVLWPDAMNTGDEYLQEEIFYASAPFAPFGPGMTSVWRDDTDIIGVMTPPELPEPRAGGLLWMALAGFGCTARRRSFARC